MSNIAESSNQPQYSVTVWEGMGIVMGAVGLVAIGVAGLMYKFFVNASDPGRATTIASSMMRYTIPGGAEGVFGANLGGAKIAIVSSPTFPKDPGKLSDEEAQKISGVELFIARVPLDVETAPENQTAIAETDKTIKSYDIFSSPDFSFSYRAGEEFQSATDISQNRMFCKMVVPIRIQTGELVLSSQLKPVFAVKYDAIALLDNGKRQVTITAIGQDAPRQAEDVFKSLRCK
jgi:hypothetical protein